VLKPTVPAIKNSVKQTHCGIRTKKSRGPEPQRQEKPVGKRKFVSATLPSLELRLAAIHAKSLIIPIAG
jgi:hypothetical protein